MADGPRPRRLPLGRALALGALFLAAGAIAGFLVSESRLPAEPPRFQLLTFRRGFVSYARFTPDGNTVVYSALWEGAPSQVFTTRIGSPESTPLALPSADVLSVSPTGELALMIDGRIARAPLGGGAPREVFDSDVHEAYWSRDGVLLPIVKSVEGKCRLEVPPGNILYETAGAISDARLSPSGDTVAFLDHPHVGDDGGEVAVISVSGKRGKRSLSRWASVSGLTWHHDGREIWVTGARSGSHAAVYAITPEGRERLVLRTPGRLRLQDIDERGRLLVTSEPIRGRAFFGSLDSSEEREVSWFDYSLGVSLSADARKVLLIEQGESSRNRFGLYLRATDGSPAARLGDGMLGELSPDGNWVLAMSQDAQRLTLYPTGPGDPVVLPEAGLTYSSLGWFPYGKRIAFTASERDRGSRLYVQEVSGGMPTPFTEELPSSEHVRLPISPDGRWAAAFDLGRDTVLWPTSGGEPMSLETLGKIAGRPVKFSSDGSALFFGQRGTGFVEIVRLDLATRKQTILKRLRPPDPGVTSPFLSDVTPDGRHYLYNYVELRSELFLVDGAR